MEVQVGAKTDIEGLEKKKSKTVISIYKCKNFKIIYRQNSVA